MYGTVSADAGVEAIIIRRAQDADTSTLVSLAALDSAEPLTGSALLALSQGRPCAALSLDDGRVIADPFFRTAGAVDLLRLRAEQIRAAERQPQRSLRRRWIAYRARA